MQVSMTGPPHLPAMDINSSIGPVSLTLSPAVVRLIIHAITTLIPQKVFHFSFDIFVGKIFARVYTNYHFLPTKLNSACIL